MRIVRIEKIGNTTKVTTKNSVSDPNPQRFDYNGVHQIRKENPIAFSVETVYSREYPRLIVLFDELEIKHGAANINEYMDEMAERGYFNSNFGTGGSGGGPVTTTEYNVPNIYQLGNLTLPHTFTGGTLHSISITCTTGTLSIIVNGTAVVLEEGHTVNYNASTELESDIVITSTTGTYTISTIIE